ncbi:NADP-dependent oxidoreductase domain-containing protein [Chiua virens]|nr:NADP-dependent oxidoreductase domain-containing protein [Chiua virens]
MSSFMAPVAKPPSRLARYRALSPNASIHVSPIQLGGMSIGDKWEQFNFGSMNKESSFELLDAFYDAGGNFIDTANFYQAQTSEEFIGEWAEQRGIRDQLVIATKYTANFVRGEAGIKQHAMYAGNNIKSMHLSVEASLKKLRTTYIDIFYVHCWDWDTSIEEVMNGLHALVQQGKVLYLGISDTPAWKRSFERDIIPMCKAHGMALAPWGVLARGKFRTDKEEERRNQTGEKGRMHSDTDWKRSEQEKAVTAALEKVAKEVGAKHVTAVAIAYVMQKTPYVFPIIGGRKVEHLQANLEALEIVLTPEHIKYLESIVPFDLGFPTAMIGDGSDYMHLRDAAYIRPIVPDLA